MNLSTYFAAVKFVDRLLEHINRLQIHEYGNWERGRADNFWEYNKSDLVCSANERHSLRQANNLTAGMTAYHNITEIFISNMASVLDEKPENLTEKPSTISK
jgi:hypothetical protein